MNTLNIETKHELAAILLSTHSIDALKNIANSEVSSGIDFLPTILEFNASKIDALNSEYLYAIIHFGRDESDVTHIDFIDAKGIDHAVNEMTVKLALDHSDLNFSTHKELCMKWLSDYDEDDMTAFD